MYAYDKTSRGKIVCKQWGSACDRSWLFFPLLNSSVDMQHPLTRMKSTLHCMSKMDIRPKSIPNARQQQDYMAQKEDHRSGKLSGNHRGNPQT